MSEERTGTESKAAGRDRVPAWLFLFALLSCLVYGGTEAFLLSGDLGFPLDDSWIHLQFARQLIEGEGLSFRSGQMVTASTAPLWTAFLALLHYLPGSTVVWVKVFGALLFVLGAGALHRLARQLGLEPWLAGCAGVLYAMTSSLVWSALSGMEIPLFALLSLWGLCNHLAERRQPERLPVSVALFALATLARPEGALLLLLALGDFALCFDRREHVLRVRLRGFRRLWPRALLVLVVLAPTLLFFIGIGGSPLPTTYSAKAGDSSVWLPSAGYLYTVFGIFFRPQPIMTLLAVAGGLVLVKRVGGAEDAGLLPTLWVFALPLCYGALSGAQGPPLVGNFGRYFFPLFPFVILLGAVAGQAILGRRGLRLALGRTTVPIPVLAILLSVAPSLLPWLQGSTRLAQGVANVADSDVALARWISQHLPADAVLAVQDVGALGYFTANPLVDLSGLVTPQAQALVRAARSPQDPMGAAGMKQLLEETRPDFVICFPNWFPPLTREGGGLRHLATWEIPDNITMGGDRLLIFATPWTRYPLPELPSRHRPRS